MEQELLLSHQCQFVDIYQQIRRGSGSANMKSLQSLIVSLRRTIMTHKTPSVQKSHFTILKLLFKLIVYTRDICGGLGEREIAYSMLFIWKYHFPVPTAHCLHKIVMSSFGSWRDVKGFCEFIRIHSEKGMEDPFIETCIGLMNHQLNEDARAATSIDGGISLVSRWIPREGSAYGWLFERCSLQWIRAFRPHYLKKVGNSEVRFLKAFKKGKKEYRLLCSSLSQATDTLQIKQCANQWATIDPKLIPMRALSTQQNALLNIGVHGSARLKTVLSDDRKACASKIKSSFLSTIESSEGESVFVEMGSVIKLALHHTSDMNRIESLWSLILCQIPNSTSHMIPILDMSLFHTDVEVFYHALGMAMAIACKGDQKRMIVFDTTAQFVSLSGNLAQMLDMMKPIFHEHHIGSELKNAFSLYLHEETPADVLVVFCNKNNNIGDIVMKLGCPMPSILCWAHSDTRYPSFVGYTNHTLARIAELPHDTWKHVTPFIFIQYLLSDKRYDAIDTYFDSIFTASPK
jgi:hypothetical protein